MCMRIVVISRIYCGYLVLPSAGAIQTGAVNEKAREVVAELNYSLAEQPTSTAALLEQPACQASPVVLPPVISLGPEPVTDQMRAEEWVEERVRRQAKEPRPRVSSGEKSTAPKKKKAIPPELEERQKRAAIRMLELGVPPLQEDYPRQQPEHLSTFVLLGVLAISTS